VDPPAVVAVRAAFLADTDFEATPYSHRNLAAQKSKRNSRKRRSAGGTPRAVPSPRREQRAERESVARRETGPAQRQLGAVGERPKSPFGGVPVSELAIFAGLVAVVVWLFRGGTATLVVGLVVCTLGVLEVTAREHFSGYRSHTTLLAAVPAVAISIGLVSAIGTRKDRAPLLILVAAPVFSILFWVLRKRFMAARQSRVVRRSAP
jgi:hypothetical protein